MHVDLVSWPAVDSVTLCGGAAAICAGGSDPQKSLSVAMKSGHDSVLEHACFTFRVEGVSRALLAQLTRHRIASYSVKSQRYCDMNEMPVVVPPTISANPDMMVQYAEIVEDIKDFYRKAINAGIPREDARYITPQAAQTELIISMNARELRHFFALRCCNKAQWEIRCLADSMLLLVKAKAPVLFGNAGPGCMRGKCPEAKPCGHPRRGV